MKILHVIPHVHEEASGPAYSVPALCSALARRGHEVELMCLAAGATPPGVTLTVHPEWSIARRFSVSPALAADLRRRAAGFDIVHNHSLWAMPNVVAGCLVPGRAGALVTSPRGTLLPAARERSRVLKSLLWPLQRRAVVRAALLHATSAKERDALIDAGFGRPIALVPNGVDIPPRREQRADGARRLLYLGRLHPVKGLERLLEAWAKVRQAHPAWRLEIVGKGEAAHEAEVRARASALGDERTLLSGPRYGADKQATYAEADLFVLPSFTENFGMVVAEALAHGVPVVVSRGAPWADVERERCGWWTDNSVEALASALDGAMSVPDQELKAMGERGRAWMRRDFGWDTVAERMTEAYRWALERGTPPPTVSLPR